MKVKRIQADILIAGGGAAGCYSAIVLAEEHPELSVALVDKANINRSGCLAAGVNALNAYITPGHKPEDYADYASADAEGIVRYDLLQTMAEGLNQATHHLERLGLVILKDEKGQYVSRGWRNIKINGENIKPILAKAVRKAGNVQVIEHVNLVDYLKDEATGRIIGAWGIGVNDEAIYIFQAKATICATGGAAGMYRPNHPGISRHKMWYSPFNTGAGYAMGLRAGAEMTTFEMRFIALRCKDTIAPTGTLAQGIGAKQVNAKGELYQAAYGNTTAERLYAVVSENLAGRGPCYLQTKGISAKQQEDLEKAYLNMAPAQTMKWRETGLGPSTNNVEVEGSEPYVVGGHTASGYWIDARRATTLQGLFAAGDVAGGCPQKYVTGAFVEGKVAARSAAAYAGSVEFAANSSEEKAILAKVESLLSRQDLENSAKEDEAAASRQAKATIFSADDLEEAMQQVMDEYAGGISTAYRYTESNLAIAAKHIARLARLSESLKGRDNYELVKIFELQERLLICRILIEHLRARKETRWHSFAENLDYPEKDAAYDGYINSRLENGKIRIIQRQLVGRGECYEHQH